jgi:hypothetical protein
MDWWDVGVGIAIGYFIAVALGLRSGTPRSPFGDDAPKKVPPRLGNPRAVRPSEAASPYPPPPIPKVK